MLAICTTKNANIRKRILGALGRAPNKDVLIYLVFQMYKEAARLEKLAMRISGEAWLDFFAE